MFFVRSAAEADLPDVLAAAQHLDSVNLPNARGPLAQIIARSERSFAGDIDPAEREFLFVLVDRSDDAPARERVVGASMIFAQHGSRQSPHTFFDVIDEERYSQTLDRLFRHTVLRIGYSYQGLTEIGGLVVLPEYRGRPEQLGKLLAYVRFQYMGLHRQVFRDEVVSELMPPLETDGTSLLWEALGRHFTGLTYQEADRLSRENKEFIRTLFPQDAIYTTLLPPAAQALIGQVGPASKPVERLLRRLGFSYGHRIDPFDGGPHFHADTDQISLVRTTRRLRLGETAAASPAATGGDVDALAASTSAAAPHFRAVRARVTLAGDEVILPAPAASTLGLTPGDAVAITPLPTERG